MPPAVSAPTFQTPRNRDAWGAIRGFVYQVDLTIERWLALGALDLLELESGEDIDTLVGALAATGSAQTRLLEQIKQRQASLTLRTRSAVEAVASAIELSASNAGLKLQFRYVTNAVPGVERFSPMPGREPAVDWWERVRRDECAGSVLDEALEGIHKILKAARKPGDLAAETWAQYRRVFKAFDRTTLLTLIRSFEWATRAADAEALSDRLVGLLLEQGRAPDRAAAQSLYQRLFLFVFKLLSRAGPKRLSAKELNEHVAGATVSAEDQALLKNINVTLAVLSTEIGALRQLGEANSAAVALVDSRVDTLTRDLALSVFDPDGNVTLDHPPLPRPVEERRDLVDAVTATLARQTGVAIHGPVAVGKSVLALLIASAANAQVIWVQPQPGPASSAAHVVNKAFAQLMREPAPVRNLGDWYRRVCERIKALGVTVVVLDGLPAFAERSPLAVQISGIATACAAFDLRLLATGRSEIPPGVVRDSLTPFRCPPFTDDEAARLLHALGAPSEFDARIARLVNVSAAGYPTIIRATARLLESHGWTAGGAVLSRILSRTHDRQFEREVINELVASVGDNDDRELLHRLRLISRDFTMDEVRAVAAVATAVGLPRERVLRLSESWIQVDPGDRLRISPLLSAIPSADLLPETAKDCHRVIATTIMSRPRATQWDFVHAIGHYYAAGDAVRAVAVLIYALHHLASAAPDVPHAGLLDLWWDDPLPPGVSKDAELMLRAIQLRMGDRRDRPRAVILERLDRLLDSTDGIDPRLLIGALVSSADTVVKIDLERACRYIALAIDAAPDGLGAAGIVIDGAPHLDVDTPVWLVPTQIRSREDLAHWVALLSHLHPDQRRRAANDPTRIASLEYAANRLWLREYEKPAATQDWVAVSETLRWLAARGRDLDLEPLWAAAVATELVVLGECLHRVDEAIALGRDALSAATGRVAVYMLADSIARQELFADRHESAIVDFSNAIDHLDAARSLSRVHTLLYASNACGMTDAVRAVGLAADGVRAANDTEVPESELVKALGELMLAHWLCGDLRAAYAAASDAGRRLLDATRDDEWWSKAFARLAYAVLHFACEVAGRPPPVAESGPSIRPGRGFFMGSRGSPVQAVDPKRYTGLYLQLARAGTAVGDAADGARWALTGLVEARRLGDPGCHMLLALEALSFIALAGDYAEVLSAADEHVEAMLRLPGLTARAIAQAEELVVEMGVVPVALRLATRSIQDRDGSAHSAAEFVELARARANDQPPWVFSLRILVEGVTGASTFLALKKMAEEGGRAGSDAAHILGYVGATLQPDALPKHAVTAHVVAFGALWKLYAGAPALREPAVHFLEAYWRHALTKASLHFRRPSRVLAAFEEAAKAPVELRAGKMLGVIADGLGVPFDDVGFPG